MAATDIDRTLKNMTHGDLRVQCRARGLTPAGGREALADRLKESMHASGDYALKADDGSDVAAVTATAGQSSEDIAHGRSSNNYSRPSGQNVGNYMTDRPSSRVLAAPGGRSQIVFGDSEQLQKPRTANSASSHENIFGVADKMSHNSIGANNNNYARPGGQNVGNMITDRSSSRVLAPPGGKSQIIFG